MPNKTDYAEEYKAMTDKLYYLCDMSDMLELPLDKDGEVIRPGDTVYDINDIKCEVIGYMLDINKVILALTGETLRYCHQQNS